VYELELRVEEELKPRRELMCQGFELMEQRFEALNRRLDRLTIWSFWIYVTGVGRCGLF
jgi:hypothetical protein